MKKLVLIAVPVCAVIGSALVIADDTNNSTCAVIQSLRIGMDTAGVERALGPTVMISKLYGDESATRVTGRVLSYDWPTRPLSVWAERTDVYMENERVSKVRLKKALLESVLGRRVVAFAHVEEQTSPGSADTNGDWLSRFAFRCSSANG